MDIAAPPNGVPLITWSTIMILAVALVSLLVIASVALLVLDQPSTGQAMNVTRALSSDEQIVVETVEVPVAWKSFDDVRASWADDADAGLAGEARKSA